MKSIVTSLFVFGLCFYVYAEDIDIKGIQSHPEDTTLIQIKKVKEMPDLGIKPRYEINEGQEDIIADGAILTKQAKENWKRACKEWKAELKENNKGNQILSSNCGAVKCGSEGNETVCRSSAKYKLKVRMDE